MRSCIWFALLVAVTRANFTAAPSGKKREMPYFCLGPEEEFFVCATSKQCLNKRAVCDGFKDCTDNSDEAGCACARNRDCKKGHKCRKNLDLAESHCTPCKAGKLFTGVQCQDIDECKDKNVCAGRGSCVNFDGGYTCVHCPNGYEARMHDRRDFIMANNSADGSPDQLERRDTLRLLFLCDDEDECANEDPCRLGGVFGDGGKQRYCVNRVGNFSCECPPNHGPRDDTMGNSGDGVEDNVCQALGGVPMIAIAERSAIGLYDLRSTELVTSIGVDEPLVDIAAGKQKIFYAFARQIWEYRVGTDSRTLIVNLEWEGDLLSEIKRLAVDWLNDRIYYLTGDAIAVANFFGEGGTIIEHRDNISTLAVDPAARYLFYSEHGSVKRAHLDGRPSGSAGIFRALDTVEGDAGQGEEALAIDPNLRSIYYIYDRVLYSFDYSGHYAIVLSTQAPYARLEPFENRLYAVYRGEANGLVSLPRIGYTIGRREGRASTVKFYKSQPISMAVLHPAKHPAGPDDKACTPASGHRCTSNSWCFPLPTKHLPNYRCPCGQIDESVSSVRHDCIPLKLQRLRPVGSLQEEEGDSESIGPAAEINAASSLVPSVSERLASTLLTFLVVVIVGGYCRL